MSPYKTLVKRLVSNEVKLTPVGIAPYSVQIIAHFENLGGFWL